MGVESGEPQRTDPRMAGQHRKRSKAVAPWEGVASWNEARAGVVRLLEKGNAKEAVKQAKALHRARPEPESHALLGRAYLERAEQLRDAGLIEEAREVAGHLQAHGVGSTEWTARAARLFAEVGMVEAARALGERLKCEEDRRGLELDLVDRAVVDPARAPESLREPIARVREALDALAQGEDEAAIERVAGIPRSSPLADWRWLIHVLIPFYRGQEEVFAERRARLDPRRVPARIVAALAEGGVARRVRDQDGRDTLLRSRASLAALPSVSPDYALLSVLDQLSQAVQDQHWRTAFRLIREARPALARLHPEWPARLTRILLWPLLRAIADQASPSQGKQLAQGFRAAAEPLPIDPHWNRFLACAAIDGRWPMGDAQRFLRAYIDDLATLPSLAPEVRPLAQALCLRKLAEVEAEDGLQIKREILRGESLPSEEWRPDRCEARALEAIRQAVRLAPDAKDILIDALQLHLEAGLPRQAIALARDWLQRHPRHDQILALIVSQGGRLGEFRGILPEMDQLLILKPLDPIIRLQGVKLRLLAVAEAVTQALAGRGPGVAAAQTEPLPLAVVRHEVVAHLTIADQLAQQIPGGFWQVEVELHRACAAFRLGQPAEASQAFQRARDLYRAASPPPPNDLELAFRAILVAALHGFEATAPLHPFQTERDQFLNASPASSPLPSDAMSGPFDLVILDRMIRAFEEGLPPDRPRDYLERIAPALRVVARHLAVVWAAGKEKETTDPPIPVEIYRRMVTFLKIIQGGQYSHLTSLIIIKGLSVHRDDPVLLSHRLQIPPEIGKSSLDFTPTARVFDWVIARESLLKHLPKGEPELKDHLDTLQNMLEQWLSDPAFVAALSPKAVNLLEDHGVDLEEYGLEWSDELGRLIRLEPSPGDMPEPAPPPREAAKTPSKADRRGKSKAKRS